jgi:VanZ family protein
MFVMTSLPDPERALGSDLPVRDTTAHTIGFFVLMLLAARLAVFLAGEFRLRVVLYALAACLIYAVTDELHQIPVRGRWFAWADVLSDALGAAAGMVVAVVVGWWRAGRAAD